MNKKDTKKENILSGIRSTGKLHIGNYLGALQNFVRLQDLYHCYFFIADLHSLNEPYNPKEKYNQILEQVADYIASGLDPNKCTIFLQSLVSEHSELAIILSNVIPVSYLFRMTQFKEKSADRSQNNINSALLYYPVLMAADILLYKPSFIPVGDDQTQHVELARDVARFFNNRFGQTFSEPKPLYTQMPRVMSLIDPYKKMSKSSGDAHCIYIDDDLKVIRKKLARAVTDTGDGKSQGAENLLELIKIFISQKSYIKKFDDKKKGVLRYAELKEELAKGISDYFSDFRNKKKILLQDKKKLEKILIDGAEEAKKVAKKTFIEAKKKAGISPS